MFRFWGICPFWEGETGTILPNKPLGFKTLFQPVVYISNILSHMEETHLRLINSQLLFSILVTLYCRTLALAKEVKPDLLKTVKLNPCSCFRV